MSTIRTKGILIRKTEYSENSLIVTFYTEKLGKLQCAAKGARRPKSQFKGTVDLFNNLDIAFYEPKQKKQEIHTLIDSNLLNPYLFIRQNVSFFTAAAYCVDLVNSLVSLEDPDKRIYSLIDTTFQLFPKTDNLFMLLRMFEISLLSYTGFLSENLQCSRCGKITAPSAYISPVSQACFCRKCRPPQTSVIDQGTLRILSLLHNAKPGTLPRLKMSSLQKRQLDSLLRTLINHACERSLKTRKILDEMLDNQV